MIFRILNKILLIRIVYTIKNNSKFSLKWTYKMKNLFLSQRPSKIKNLITDLWGYKYDIVDKDSIYEKE